MNDELRIGMFTSADLTLIGGIESVVKYLAINFAEQGVKVFLFIPFKNRKLKINKGNITVIPLFPFFSRLAFNKLKILDWISTLIIKIYVWRYGISLIHVHSTYPYGVIFGRMRPKLPINTCLSLHGSDIQESSEFNYGFRNGKISDLIKRWIKNHDLFFAPSENIQNILMTMNIPLEKTVVIYHGAPYDEIQNTTMAEYNKPEKGFKFISVGRNVPIKGYHFAIETFFEVKKANGAFIYMIIGRNTHKLQLLIEKYGLTDNISLVADANTDAVFRYMKESDLYILPSIMEGFPLVKAEALQCGLPIITTNAPGCHDFIINYHNGFICERDPEIFATKILEVMNNRTLLESLKRGALDSSKELSWNKISKKYLKSYQSLITA